MQGQGRVVGHGLIIAGTSASSYADGIGVTKLLKYVKVRPRSTAVAPSSLPLTANAAKNIEYSNAPFTGYGPFGRGPVPTSQATQTLTHKNGIFEVLSEQGISGTTRSAHRTAANRGLSQQLEADAQLNRQLSEILGVPDVAAHMRSGRSALRNPPGTEWHHPIDNQNAMILLRRQVHRHPDLQGILHPGNIGGFGTHYGN